MAADEFIYDKLGLVDRQEIPVIFLNGFQPSMSFTNPYVEESFETSTSITLEKQRMINDSIRRLKSIYIFDNPRKIEQSLLTNDHLRETLLELPPHIYDVFGRVPLRLALRHDLEEGFEGFFVIVKTSLSIDDSLDLLDKFDEGWWINVDKEVKKHLTVDV